MKNLMRIYAIMMRHYGYLIAGVFFMLGFAVFSGVSITMAVPFFDHIFPQVKGDISYHTFSEMFLAIKEITIQFIGNESIWTLFNVEQIRPLLAEYGVVLEKTDSMLVLKVVAGAVFVLIICKNIFFYLNRLMFANLNGRTIVDIRNRIFQNYLAQSLNFFHHYRVGDALVRMVSDVEIVSQLFIVSIFNAIRDLLLVLVFMRIAIFLNLRLFLISLVVLPLSTYLIAMLGTKIKKYARRIQGQFSNIYSQVEEILHNIKVVKAFAREDDEYDRFQKINQKFFLFWRKAQIYSGLNVPISELNGTITGIIILLIGGSEVVSGSSSFTFGEFGTFLFAIFSMLHPMKTISKTYTDIKKAMVSLDRVSEVMYCEPELSDNQESVEKKSFDKSIEFRNVSFTYDKPIDEKEGRREVLKNVSFTINKGEKIAVVGRSGSGKTTLTSLLLRFYEVRQGELLIDDIPTSKIKLNDLRSLFGIVTQESLLFTSSIEENIRFGTHRIIGKEDVIKACKTAYADEFIEQLPDKYDQILHSKASNLSGGQKQRLCIARAIVGDPPILIFDEATSALDTEAEQKVQKAIEQATEARTVIMIAHRLSTILSADRIIVMDEGEIVAVGSNEELLGNCPTYKKLHSLQFNL